MHLPGLEEELAAAKEQQLTQASALSAAQADLGMLTEAKQALQQQLATNHDELDQSLHQLEGLKQDIDEREEAYRQQSDHASKLQAQLLASKQIVQALQAQRNSQTDKIAGDTAKPWLALLVSSLLLIRQGHGNAQLDTVYIEWWPLWLDRQATCSSVARCLTRCRTKLLCHIHSAPRRRKLHSCASTHWQPAANTCE